MGYLRPVDARISDSWAGHRNRPKPSTEPGTDYAAGRGTPVRAAEAGRVVDVKRDAGGATGRFVTIDLDDGRRVRYLHLQDVYVNVGARVARGTHVGTVGGSGFGSNSGYGVHVHTTLWSNHAYRFGKDATLDFERYVGGGNGGGGGSAFSQEVKNQQTWLISRGYNLGPSGADGYKGDANSYTTRAIKAYQEFLKKSYGYTGPIDGIWGSQGSGSTQAAHQRFYDEVTKPKPKPPVNGHPAFPLNSNQYFGPEAGDANSISGHHGHREDLRLWQQRMKDRGWPITADGLYSAKGSNSTDTETGKTAKAFQAEKGLTVDGKIGPSTWNAAWEAPVTPANPTPTPTPTPTPDEKLDNRTSRPVAEIWAFLKAAGYSQSVQGVKDWQAAQAIDSDGIWGSTSDGLAFPPAGSTKGVDYSFARPDPAMLKSRGIKLAGRYLWREKYDDGIRTNKGINKAELANLKANGIDVFFIYEEDGKELLGGRAAGVRVANEAEKFLKGLGLEGYPIYFNVDYDAPAGDLPKIMDALDGIASVIGKDRVGLYAGYGPLKAAFDAGKIAWGFQTYAWSGGKWDSRAQLQQWSNNQWNGSVDFTRAMVKEYGQNPVKKVDPPVTPPVDNDQTTVPKSWLQELIDKAKGYLSK